MYNNENLPIEERRNQPLRSTGKYIVDKSVPYEQLSLIQKLAVDQFDGDVELAFDYLFSSTDHKTQEKYTENLTQWEARAGVQSIKSGINQKLTKKEIQEIVDVEHMLAHINMSREQVRDIERNPFLPKLWNSLGALLLCSIGIGVVVGLGKHYLANQFVVETITLLLGCVSTYFLYKVVAEILNVCRFRKVKRIISEEESERDNRETAE